MGAYTVKRLIEDMRRLGEIEREKKAIGFRPIPHEALKAERKVIKERMRGSGFDVDISERTRTVFISLEDQEGD